MTICRPSLIVLGASGGVAQAFLQLLPDIRAEVGSLYLVDQNDSVTRHPYIPHSKLHYRFIQADINACLPAILSDALKGDDHLMVLDLTDQATQPTLQVIDSHGLHYVNCSLNTADGSMKDYLAALDRFEQSYRNGSHLLGVGMNPGIINHMFLDAISRHGVPRSFDEIEYDSAFPLTDPGTPFITWSKHQFLNESVYDYSGYCGKNGVYIELASPAIVNPHSMKALLAPILDLNEYPDGLIVAHDEIITLSHKYSIPGRFIYAIHPTSLQRLRALYAQHGTVRESDVVFLENVESALEGADTIGVWLNYLDRRVCSWCQVLHKDIVGTNATLFMVAVGVLASLVESIKVYPGASGVSSVEAQHTKRLLSTVKRYITIQETQEDYAHAETAY